MNGKALQLMSERLILNEISEKDTELIVRWRSDPDVYKFFLSPHPLTMEEHQNWYGNQYLCNSNRLDWIALEKNSKTPIGLFGIKRSAENETEAEVSYLLESEFYGKGYAGESLGRILKFAAEEWSCNSVAANIHVDNQKSIKFIRKLGFVCSGRDGNFVKYRKIIVTANLNCQ